MDHDKLLNLGAELGRQLMASGAEIYRVEESVNRLLTAYGLQPQVFAIPNCLIVSVNTPEGHPLTRMCRIPAHGTDIELLERCNALCRRLCREVPPIDQALSLVNHLQDDLRHFPAYVLPISYMVTSAFFALFFGGSLPDCLSAALCGLSVALCGLFGHFMGDFLARRAVQSDPEAARALEIEQKDERNVAIGNAAKARAFDVMLTTFSPLLLIFALLEVDLLPLLLLVAAYLFIVFDSIYWLNRFQKEM